MTVKLRTRASVYLVSRATALKVAIDFFDSGDSRKGTGKTRKLIFLSQIDFWEWEMENVLYAFESFEGRRKAWSGYGSLQEAVVGAGFIIKTSILGNVKNSHRDMDQRRKQALRWAHLRLIETEVVVPLDDLRSLITTWNDLLDRCDKLIGCTPEQAANFGASSKMPSQFKKTIPQSLS